MLVSHTLTEPAKSDSADVASPANLTIDAVPAKPHLQEVVPPVSTAVAVPIDISIVAPDLLSPFQPSVGLTSFVSSLLSLAPATAN